MISDLSRGLCPLDIFLTRAHGLPLPYLTGGGLSFLVHASPLGYMRLSPATEDDPPSDVFDVPISRIRSTLKNDVSPALVHPIDDNLTWATVSLEPLLTDTAYTFGMPVGLRPAFEVRVNLESEVEKGAHILPRHRPENGTSYGWMVTIEGGGVVMSESRMRDIQHILGLSSEHLHGYLGVRYLWAGSWVDLLVSKQAQRNRFLTRVCS